MDIQMEALYFEIITMAGTATGLYSEAIKEAKLANFDEARSKMKEGDEAARAGHSVHVDLIQKEASGEGVDVNLILLHAEDQMMMSENMKNMAIEFISLYELIYERVLSK